MSRCPCGADHEADRKTGAERSRIGRCDRWGPPFETVAEGALHKGQPLELRAVQTDDGAWEAIVYSPEYEALAGCEVGKIEFMGYAPTEGRARGLARDAAATALAKYAAWRVEWAKR